MTVTRSTTSKLRKIAESFIVARPTGTSTRTRLRPTAEEAVALRQIGDYLGSAFRSDLVARTKIGTVPKVLNQRTERKRGLNSTTSSRWAGSITRAAEDQYQLGMRGLVAEVQQLTAAILAIEKRLTVPVGTTTVAGVAGYRSRTEHAAKTVRAVGLKTRLTAAETNVSLGTPAIAVGGSRLWKARQNLVAAGLTEPQWRTRWDSARMFLTADGESGALFGNYTIRVETDGTLQIKVPAALVNILGPRLRITAPITFALRGDEWADRVKAQQSIRYDITYDADVDRWYVNASWSYPAVPVPPVATFWGGRIVGVDLNADHLTAAIIDASGNPVGTPDIIPLLVDGLTASTRDGHLRQAITTLLDSAVAAGAAAIAIENLNFSDARTSGRETMGRGSRGKRFRRTVAGIPTGKFRERLTAMAANRGIHIIAVDPAYTSRWGAQHWTVPLRQRTSDHTATRHQAAAVAIGRRAHGHRIRRKKDGVRSQQRMRLTTPLTDPRMKPVNAGPEKARARHQPPKLTG